ncbi:MAG: radical SAM protein [Proteobacteria bacterium]|nr:radical SAM protein [Pseudomonadota bacterium]
MSRKPNIVKQAWLVINSSCNNHCSWCYEKKRLGNKEEFDYKLLRSTIKQLSLIGCKKIVFIGGEPSLYHKLKDAVGFASSTGLKQCIVTNGKVFSSESFLDRLNANKELTDFIVSFMGASEITHDSLSQVRGSFIQSFKGLTEIIKKGFVATPNFTVGSINKNEIKQFINKMKSIGVEAISINFAIPPLGITYTQENFLSPKEISLFLEGLSESLPDSTMKIYLSTPLPFCIIPNNARLLVESGIIVLTSCHIQSGEGIVIDKNLNLLVCTHFSGFNLCNLQTLNTETKLSEYLSNPALLDLRSRIRQLPFEDCHECSYNTFCTGGCPLLNIIYNKDEWRVN